MLTVTKLFSILNEREIDESIQYVLRYILHRKENKKSKALEHILKKLFERESFFNAFKRLHLKRVNEIIVSRNYLIFKIEYAYKRRYYYCSHDISVETEYLIGVDSESHKLFIEKIDVFSSVLDYIDHFTVNNVRIYFVEDSKIRRRVFNYQIDYDYDRIILHNRRIRIQGDLVIVLEKDTESYFSSVKTSIIEHLVTFMRNYIRNKIREILEDYGLNVDNHSVECLTSTDDLDSLKTIVYIVLKNLNLSEIEKEFNILNLEVKEIKVDKYWNKIEIDFGYFTISFTVSTNRELLSEKYHFIHYDVSSLTGLIHKYADKIFEMLKREGYFDFSETKIRVGRHLIITKALPLSLIFQHKVLNNNVTFTITNLPILCKSFIKVIHPEHEHKLIKLYDTYILNVNTIFFNDRFYARLNKYQLEILRKKYKRKVKEFFASINS